MNKYQFVTALHGNESLPTLALASMSVEQVVGNPRAVARGVRYTEHDLNAAFGTNGKSYEENRARELLRLIKPDALVVDFHTFSCESEPFVIIVDMDMLALASSLGVKHVVYMKHNIKAGHALINHRQGVSVEVGKHGDPRSFAETLAIVKRFKFGLRPKRVRLYEVYGRIEERGQYENFVEKDGFVPVLYGERAYPEKGFYGLKAREITSTIQTAKDI